MTPAYKTVARRKHANVLTVALIPRYRVSLVREATLEAEYREIHNSADAASILRATLGEDIDRECFAVLYLDSKNKVIGSERVSIGSLSLSIVHPREVFTGAIAKKAATIIAGHNHPSGNPEPSAEDIALTERLREGGEILGIHLLDHVIVGDGTSRHYSFADAGRFPTRVGR